MSLLKRVGLNPGYMMTGGVAKNPGVVAVLEEQLGEKLHIVFSDRSQMIFNSNRKTTIRYDWKINRITIVVVKLFSGL